MSQCMHFENIEPAVVSTLFALAFLSSTVCCHCIEINRNSVNQSKGQITLKISPWGRTSLAMIQRFGLFLLKTVANKILRIH